MAMAGTTAGRESSAMTGDEKKVIFASSLGTVFEWYDFYLYGWTAAQIGAAFYSAFDANTQFIFALLTFSAGFLVRPFGALVFGRVGDLVGRKYTFLVTITIMGLSTFLVGLTPGYQAIGWLAPAILIGLRLLQGLALGGEYGGAATYVAEHAPHGRRGFYTSWIQTTATIGLFLSLLIVYVVRNTMTPGAVRRRRPLGRLAHPYLLSIVLLGISIWIRLQLRIAAVPEDEGRGQGLQGAALGSLRQLVECEDRAARPVRPDRRPGRDLVRRAVLCARLPGQHAEGAGQHRRHRTDHRAVHCDGGLPVVRLAVGRIGRKPIILAGCLLGAVTYHCAFSLLTHAANPALEKALANAPVTVIADPADCNVLFDPVGGRVFKNSCDVAVRP